MGLFVLQETPAGYALFKSKSSKVQNITENDDANELISKLKLKHFHKFDNQVDALEQAAALVDGKVTPRLSSLLDTLKDEVKASLAVADPKLASAINKLPQLDLKLVSDATTTDMYRAIRDNLDSLIPGLSPEAISTMSLGLSHSLSRHKLKFSTDKVDTMIIQAISLLDILDKELNTYAMRLREWYGWHFPEMAKIVNDNLAYARIVIAMGMRSKASKADLATILPEEIEQAVKAAAEISMGTEITEDDLELIIQIAEIVVNLSEDRAQLAAYLTSRMIAIAPNLTALVGDLVGARLIAHSGSLMNLAKAPASTLQILGAEKALFRALKTKHDTPKYGLLYHSSLVGQASGKNKGKIARVLAARASLGLRVDALADWSQGGDADGDEIAEEQKAAFGYNSREKIERRLAQLEGKVLRPKGVAIAPNGVSYEPGKWSIHEARKYNADADGLVGNEGAKRSSLTEELDGRPRKKAKNDQITSTPAHSQPVETVAEPDPEVSDNAPSIPDVDMINGAQPAVSAVRDAPPLIQEISEKPEQPTVRTADGADLSSLISEVSSDSADSADSLTPQQRNWQSPIEGNTKAAKKARRIERHARKLAISEDRSTARREDRAKVARRLDRQKRREKRDAQLLKRSQQEGKTDLAHAAEAGLSLKRYKRKLERGEIGFDETGTAHSISKKDIKRAKKDAQKATSGTALQVNGDAKEDKKRKRDVNETDGNDLNGQVEGKKRKTDKADTKEEKKKRKEEKKARKAAKAKAG